MDDGLVGKRKDQTEREAYVRSGLLSQRPKAIFGRKAVCRSKGSKRAIRLATNQPAKPLSCLKMDLPARSCFLSGDRHKSSLFSSLVSL